MQTALCLEDRFSCCNAYIYDAMTDALSDVPVALADEYSDLALVRQTAQAFVYRARDGLGDSVTITEIFHDSLCSRVQGGAVAARDTESTAWSAALSGMKQQIGVWSRLVHPALCSIDQVFDVNGTLYIVTRDVDGQPLDRLLPDIDKILEPRQIQASSERLIDLLAYLHAFGVTGLRIIPESLIVEDQEASILLSLQRLLDGSVSLAKNAAAGAAEDCRVLAGTLHRVVTGQLPSLPYKPVAASNVRMPATFLETLDSALKPATLPAGFSARAWSTRALGAPAKGPKLRAWVPVAAGLLLCTIGAGAWYLATHKPQTTELRAIAHNGEAAKGAGPWQLELPLQIVRADGADGAFILRQDAVSPEFAALNPWAQDGLVITEMNGAPVTEAVDLRALALSSDPTVDSVELTSLTVKEPDLPLQQNVAVIPYLWREKTYGAVRLREQVTADGWKLTVVNIEPGVKLPLEVGDVLGWEQDADLALRRFTDLDRLLQRLEATANPSLTVMVRRRDSSRLVVGFAAQRLLEEKVQGSDE